MPKESAAQSDNLTPVKASFAPSGRRKFRAPWPKLRERLRPSDRRSLRRAAYLTAGVGLAFAVLFLLTYWLTSGLPGPQSSDAEILEFYQSDARRLPILIGTYVIPFAGIAFLWFIVALRMWIAASTRHINELSSNIQLVSGIIFIAVFFASAAATATTAAVVQFSTAPFSPTAARLLPQFGNTLTFVFAMRMAAMFIFTTSNIGRSAKILPRWFLILGYVVGIFLLLSAGFRPLFVLAFPIWMLLLCFILLSRAARIPPDARVPREKGVWVPGPLPDENPSPGVKKEGEEDIEQNL